MRDILFVGAVLATVTHEMQNVMAIIKESGALTEDILRLNGPPRLRHGEKLETALTNIQEQVGRGRDLMLMLNGFAHAAADYPEYCDLPRFARQICVLAERMARLKECSLVPELDVPPVQVRGNALMLMQTIYLGLSAVLEICMAGDTLFVNILQEHKESDRAVLRIRSSASGERSPDTTAIASLMDEIGGSCAVGAGYLDLSYVAARVDMAGPVESLNQEAIEAPR